MNPKFRYILTYFRQIYDVPAEIEIGYGTKDCKINIFASQTRYFEDFSPFPMEQIAWKTWKYHDIPFLFSTAGDQEPLEVVNGKAFINDDILAAAFFFLSGWQEYEFMRKHTALRYPYKKSLQAALNITHLPIVNYYFHILKSAIEKVYNIKLKPDAWGENTAAICLTHDIDKCYSGWIYDSFNRIQKKKWLDIPKILARRLFFSDTWFNFHEILDLEKKYDAHSSFYFIPEKNTTYLHPERTTIDLTDEALPRKNSDPDYFFRQSSRFRKQGYTEKLENADYYLRSRDIRKAFRQIRYAGSEVGIHGGFGSSLTAENFHSALNAFETPVLGGRFHYLHFDPTFTYAILEAAGLAYDSTMGFAEEAGFRHGIAFPFRPYDIRINRPYNIMQIPLAVMDTTFRSYKKTSLSDIVPIVSGLLHEAKKFHGCLTVLWHNAYFSPYKFAGWQDIYETILAEGQQNNMALLSGEEVCHRWQPRLFS